MISNIYRELKTGKKENEEIEDFEIEKNEEIDYFEIEENEECCSIF